MFICTLAALRKSSKKKEIKTLKEMVEVFKYANDRRKKAAIEKIGMIKFLTLTLYLSARITVVYW